MSGDLVEFLRARLDEDERAALCWREDERLWRVVGGRKLSYSNGAHENVAAIDVANGPLFWERIYVKRDLDGLAEHIARHDPARVLAEVAAKRRVVDLHGAGPHECVAWDEALGTTCTCYEVDCPTLLLLARPFVDHPDYRPEWAPA